MNTMSMSCILETIFEGVKRAAQEGKWYYHYHVGYEPLGLVEILKTTFVGYDVEYADPYITVRWK